MSISPEFTHSTVSKYLLTKIVRDQKLSKMNKVDKTRKIKNACTAVMDLDRGIYL
jgi:hypothetical protein